MTRSVVGLGLAALLAAGCREPVDGGRHELARFDFEDSGWHGDAQRTRAGAHSGTYATRLEVGYPWTTAWSPLIPLTGEGALELSWWSSADVVEGVAVSTLANFYGESDLVHPAIPDFPRKLTARRLQHVTSPAPGWTSNTATVDAQLIPANATALRIEVRLLPKVQGRSQLVLDDVVVSRSGLR